MGLLWWDINSSFPGARLTGYPDRSDLPLRGQQFVIRAEHDATLRDETHDIVVEELDLQQRPPGDPGASERTGKSIGHIGSDLRAAFELLPRISRLPFSAKTSAKASASLAAQAAWIRSPMVSAAFSSAPVNCR